MKILHVIAFILLVIGGLNWLLVGIWDFNLVTSLFGTMPALARTIYILVGLSAVWLLVTHKSACKECSSTM